MSIFLAQEMILGFLKTNNPLRFHRFADKIYRKTVATKCLAIPPHSTYLHELESFLFTTYGGWNGTVDDNGRSQGTMRFQTSTNHPQTDWAQDQSLIFWLAYSTELAGRFANKPPTEKDHLAVVRNMKDAIIGVGDLLAQKILFADACLGLRLPLSFFRNCTPGLNQHMKILKKPPFNFKHTDQVRQLVTSISVKGRMAREKAEETICLTLKSDASLGMYQEIAVKGCDLFSAKTDTEQSPYVRRLDFHSQQQLPVKRGGFTSSPESHYYPPWAEFGNPSKYCFNYARMTSKANFNFNVKQKTSSSQLRDLENEKIHFGNNNVDFSAAQLLLNSNRYVFLEDQIGELARYFRVSKDQFIQAIQVREEGDGYITLLNENIFQEVVLDSWFLQISEVSISRRPIVDVKNTNRKGWCYLSFNGAILALFLHCVTNVHLRHGDHWSIDYLQDTKELLLLMPVTAGLDTAAVIGVIFRNGDGKVRLRQISKRCEVLPPIIIAKDYNGIFDLQKMARRAKRN